MKERVNYILVRWQTSIKGLDESKLIAKRMAHVFGNRFSSDRICYSNAYTYIYFGYSEGRFVTQIDFNRLSLELSTFAPHLEIDVSRLETMDDLCGISHEAALSTHYVVEMDFEDGWSEDVFDWYDKEHLPGLAAVPGCIRAARFINHDALPTSHAFYELTDVNVTSTDLWLKIRTTAWSGRLRPHFRNVRRSIFSVL